MADRELRPGDHILVLADGRRLGYAVYGDPSGPVIVNCHGGWLCRTDISPAAETASELGLCIISPDRPGVGLSDRKPGHAMLDWVDEDLKELLEHLNVERFGVMGWSAGGQYALATLFRLRDHVAGCAVIAGCPPMDGWVTSKELNRPDRVLSYLSARAPWAARACFAGMHAVAAKTPSIIVDIMIKECEPVESSAVRSLGHWGPGVLAEGTRRPQGVVDEYLAMDAPWGFALEDVAGPVRVFHGSADRVIPPSWGAVIAERVPGAVFTNYPGEGHIIGLTRRQEILNWLKPALVPTAT